MLFKNTLIPTTLILFNVSLTPKGAGVNGGPKQTITIYGMDTRAMVIGFTMLMVRSKIKTYKGSIEIQKSLTLILSGKLQVLKMASISDTQPKLIIVRGISLTMVLNKENGQEMTCLHNIKAEFISSQSKFNN